MLITGMDSSSAIAKLSKYAMIICESENKSENICINPNSVKDACTACKAGTAAPAEAISTKMKNAKRRLATLSRFS